MSDSVFLEVQRLIEAAVADAYKRGRADAKLELRAILFEEGEPRAITMSLDDSSPLELGDDASTSQRKRAPKGLPRALTERTLKSRTNGVIPQDIVDAADNEYERMIAISSIRGELRKGQAEHRYKEQNGLWYIV
jgi:hypothetical protein